MTNDDEVSPEQLRYQVLGPLEVRAGTAVRTPTAAKQRVLLAVLLHHANQVLTVSDIADVVWDSRPPPSGVAALHGYVTALRRRLVPDAAPDPRQHPVLRTHPGGYAIRLAPHQLDLGRFRAFAAQGRSRLADGACREAGELLRRSLDCWSGPAFCDVRASGALSHYATRLEEDRLAVLEERIGVDLCTGQAQYVVGELTELCARHPLHEGLHQLLMQALHRTGRHAEALQVYGRARRSIVEEVGIEPGQGLRALQQAILGDGTLPPSGRHSDCRAGRHPDRTSQAHPRW